MVIQLSGANGRLCLTNIVDLDALLGKKIIAKYQLRLKQLKIQVLTRHIDINVISQVY